MIAPNTGRRRGERALWIRVRSRIDEGRIAITRLGLEEWGWVLANVPTLVLLGAWLAITQTGFGHLTTAFGICVLAMARSGFDYFWNWYVYFPRVALGDLVDGSR